MDTHHIKCWSEFFQYIIDGTKTFEVRFDDRDYKVGDYLMISETKRGDHMPTGRHIKVKVTYLMRGGKFGVADDYVVMSIKKVEK